MALAGDAELNRITGLIIRGAISVHRALGPGLLESAYTACLAYEARELGLSVDEDVPLPLDYKGVKLERGYRIDLRVNACVIVEVKCVTRLAPIHDAQLMTYLKLTGCPAGLLLNFKMPVMVQGIKRKMNPDVPTDASRPSPEK